MKAYELLMDEQQLLITFENGHEEIFEALEIDEFGDSLFPCSSCKFLDFINGDCKLQVNFGNSFCTTNGRLDQKDIFWAYVNESS